MNFLELAKKLRQECGVAGTGPTTTVGQTGQAKQLVDWINDAWLEIQGMHDNWDFMRGDFSFSTTAAVGDYSPADAGLTDHRYWYRDTLRVYLAASGVADEQYLVEWGYSSFRDTYRFGMQTTGRPVVFAVKPKDSALMFGSIPNDVYTVTGEYQRAPSSMTSDTDVPTIPAHLHMVIVYKAMEHYGIYEAAPEVQARGQIKGKALMAQLEREQLPEITLGAALA